MRRRPALAPAASHRHSRRPAVITTLLLLAGLAIGQTPASEKPAADEELASKVKALVAQLGSNELAKREAAEKGLIAIGPDVLPLLPGVTARTPAEDRVRLKRI